MTRTMTKDAKARLFGYVSMRLRATMTDSPASDSAPYLLGHTEARYLLRLISADRRRYALTGGRHG